MEKEKQILKQVRFQRKITKVGDSLYVRVGTKELAMLGNPKIVDVIVSDASFNTPKKPIKKWRKK